MTKGEVFFHPLPFFLIYRKWKWQDLDTNMDFLMEYHKLQPQEEHQNNRAANSGTIHSSDINLVNH